MVQSIAASALDPAAPAVYSVRQMLHELATSFVESLPDVFADTDPESLHAARISLRTARSVLATARAVIGDDARRECNTVLRDLVAPTGAVRDYDVVIGSWSELTGLVGEPAEDFAPLLALIHERRAAAFAAMTAALAEPMTAGRIESLPTLLAAVGPGDLALTPTDEAARDIVRKEFRRVIRHGRAIDADSPDDALHDLRKDTKRLRYTLERYATVLPLSPQRRLVKRLKALQENLGEHQDAAVHAVGIRAIAGAPDGAALAPTALVAAGRLVQSLVQVQDRTRGEFAKRFDRFDSTRTRRLVRALLAVETPDTVGDELAP